MKILKYMTNEELQAAKHALHLTWKERQEIIQEEVRRMKILTLMDDAIDKLEDWYVDLINDNDYDAIEALANTIRTL